MHILGLLGMPRRIYTYEPGRGWDYWNFIVTIGVVFQAAAVLVFLGNLLRSYFRGDNATSDPWDAWTLEWSVNSPPPEYNFAAIPVVSSRRPLWDLKHPDDPDWKYEPAEPFTYAQNKREDVVALPARTPWPIVLAFGLALVFGGLVTTALVSVLGAILALGGCVGWFRDVLPQEKHELVITVAAPPVTTNRPKIAQFHRMTGHPHRAHLPLEIHPLSAGIRGGLAGAAVMALLTLIWASLRHTGVWYPVNLLAGGFFPDRVTTAQLVVFHWDALIVGGAVFVFATVLIGLLYGAVLPMFARRPIFLGGVAVPILGSGLAYGVLGTVNPVFNERIDWPWFLICLFVFGTVAGLVVSRCERIRTWQHFSFLDRAGVEADGADGQPGGRDA